MDNNKDLTGKISELLSDEESLRQLMELAQMFRSGDIPDNGDEQDSSAGGAESGTGEDSAAEKPGDMPDIGSIMRLAGLAGAAAQGDRNTELLTALKPHLSAERQKRVDRAIKLMKLLAVWNLAKESGLLNDVL
ncbi:MAG: hypothetical protein IJ874_06345 [Ruminococcus sp.]|nr:hypothetical protein [Ruminococcus sp.]